MTTTTLPPAPAPTVATRRRRLPSDEPSLFLLGTALVALHVPRRHPAAAACGYHRGRPSGQRPRHDRGCSPRPRGPFGRVRAGWRAVLALSVGVFGDRHRRDRGRLLHHRRRSPPATTSPGCSQSPAGVLPVSLGAVEAVEVAMMPPGGSGDAWPGARCTLRWRPLQCISSRSLCCSPMRSLMSSEPWCRRTSPASTRGRDFHDLGRADAARLVHPIPQRRGDRRLPRRLGTQAHARMLARHGYGVLLFDRRGEGRSEGGGNMLGWGGDKDIIAAVDWLKPSPGRRPPTASAGSACRSAAS